MKHSKAEAVRSLRLFNEKAAKLRGLSFTKEIQNRRATVTLRLGDLSSKLNGPGDEAIDAFVLTLRFFIQDNEPSSFRNLADLYEQLPVEAQLVEEVRHARTTLNDHLDGPSDMRRTETGEMIPRRYILETFLWGGLAHANRTKQERFDRWRSAESFFPFIKMEFVNILNDIVEVIFWLEETNARALQQLTGDRQSA